MDESPPHRRPAGGSTSLAILLVGLGHLVGWSVAGLWFGSVVDVAVLGTAGSSWLEVAVAGVVLIGSLSGGAWLAARAVAHDRPLRLALLSVLAFAVGVLVVIGGSIVVMVVTDTDGFWRPPMVGAGIGAQLAVLLPRAGLGAVGRRIGVPVALDLVATLVAEPTDFRGVVAFVLAAGWFALGLATVAWVEHVADTPRRATRTPVR
jgi:hypothetical protein